MPNNRRFFNREVMNREVMERMAWSRDHTIDIALEYVKASTNIVEVLVNKERNFMTREILEKLEQGPYHFEETIERIISYIKECWTLKGDTSLSHIFAHYQWAGPLCPVYPIIVE